LANYLVTIYRQDEGDGRVKGVVEETGNTFKHTFPYRPGDARHA
jgi:hypothetical protein